MKKFSLLLAILLVITCVFTACKGGDPSQKPDDGGKATQETQGGDTKPSDTTPTNPPQTNPPVEEGYDGSAVTVKFYHTMGQNLSKVLDEYIPEFNELFPNITIEWQQVGGYDDVRDQIKNELMVGNEPNVAYCYPDHVALFNKASAVQTLDELIASKAEVKHADGTTEILGLTDEQIADYIEGYYKEGTAFGDGLMYTMPFSKSTEVLYYNKTFFDEHNLSVPTTWDEMYDVCKKIKEIEPLSTPLGYDSEANWFITLCEQSGSDYTSATGDHYLFNNETNRNFMEKLNGWYQEGLITTQALNGGYTSSLFVATGEKKSYMSIGSSAGATHQRPEKVDGKYPFEVGIATIPQVNPAAPRAISQGPSVCIFKKANMQEVYATWLFVKFLTTNVGFQADFARASGYVPVIKSVETDDIFKDFVSKADGGDYIAALSMKVCLSQVDAYFVSPAFLGSSTARDEVGSLLQKCLSITGDVKGQIETAFEDAVDECEYQN